MRDALNRRFDVVLAESLDRYSRDQEDTAGLFKRLTFAGVNIVTLAEGISRTCTSASRAR
jgi:DNA invertase Pin-like site-specific DNA recombinase